MNHRTARDVTPVVLQQFPGLVSVQATKGIRTYGHGLTTWNQRDAGLDALQELVDAMQYVTQLQMERNDLLDEVAHLRAVLLERGLLVAPDGTVVEVETDA